jgi:hypothetical protein
VKPLEALVEIHGANDIDSSSLEEKGKEKAIDPSGQLELRP